MYMCTAVPCGPVPSAIDHVFPLFQRLFAKSFRSKRLPCIHVVASTTARSRQCFGSGSGRRRHRNVNSVPFDETRRSRRHSARTKRTDVGNDASQRRTSLASPSERRRRPVAGENSRIGRHGRTRTRIGWPVDRLDSKRGPLYRVQQRTAKRIQETHDGSQKASPSSLVIRFSSM